MHEEFKRINNPVNLLREKRDDLYQYFTTAYGTAADMVIKTKNKSEKIIEGYMGRILNEIFFDVAKVTTLVPALNGNKSKLEAHVLKDLINQECFEELILYINNPKEYYERFIRRCVNDHCGTGESSCLYKIIKAAVEHYHEGVTKCMKESTEEVRRARGNVNAWLDALYMRIKDNVRFTEKQLKEAVTDEMQSKLEDFQNEMLRAWGNVDIKSSTEKIYNKERESIVDRVVKDLMKEKCGCLEQCPFCNAVCCCTQEKHDGDHSVLLHRPKAISGVKWFDTNEAVVEICSTAVKSEVTFFIMYNTGIKEFKCKEYRKAGHPYNTWSITPDDSSQNCWKWILNRFSKELKAQYKCKFEGRGKIPDEWKRITKKKAIDSLK